MTIDDYAAWAATIANVTPAPITQNSAISASG
jgi:hypothetical protein